MATSKTLTPEQKAKKAAAKAKREANKLTKQNAQPPAKNELIKSSFADFQHMLTKRIEKKEAVLTFQLPDGTEVRKVLLNGGIREYNTLKIALSTLKVPYKFEFDGFEVEINPNDSKRNSLTKVLTLMKKTYKDLKIDALPTLSAEDFQKEIERINTEAKDLFPSGNSVALGALVELSSKVTFADLEALQARIILSA